MTSKTIASALAMAASLLMIFVTTPASAQDEREQARANFLEADVNEDKQLDRDEFTTFIDLNAEDGLGRASTIRSLGMHGTAFGRVDANGDGLVSREEIEAGAGR